MARQRLLTVSFLVALLETVLLIPSASGQGCRATRFAYQVPVYSAPVYTAPAYNYDYPPIQATVIVQEVLAPAYTFQVLQAFAPPAAAPMPANTAPYQPPAAPAPQHAATPCQPCSQGTVRLDPTQLAELARLLREPPGAGEESPPPFGDAMQTSAAPAFGAQADEQAVLQYFGTACARCHTANQSPKGGVVLFDAPGSFRPYRTNGQPLPLPEVVASLSNGMPKGGPRMPQELFARIPPHWHAQGGQAAYNRP